MTVSRKQELEFYIKKHQKELDFHKNMIEYLEHELQLEKVEEVKKAIIKTYETEQGQIMIHYIKKGIIETKIGSIESLDISWEEFEIYSQEDDRTYTLDMKSVKEFELLF